MTVKEIYEYVLIECNKVGTATIFLEDFNFFVNKACQEFINKRYALFEQNQQITDDLQVLTRPANLEVTSSTWDASGRTGVTANISYGLTDKANANAQIITRPKEDGFSFIMPDNYLHLLNCVVTLEVKQQYKGRTVGDLLPMGAKRLTADMEAGIVNNEFFKPFFTRPYYTLRDAHFELMAPATLDSEPSPRLTIQNGSLYPFFDIKSIYLVYLKQPEKLLLTSAQRDSLVDSSTHLEFPDYVCNEILKMAVMYILENNSDQRLQTFAPVNTDSTQSALQGQRIDAAQQQQAANRR